MNEYGSATIIWGENSTILSQLPPASFPLIYIDPPFNTGKLQSRPQLRTVRDEHGDRVGYQEQRYRTIRVKEGSSYLDRYEDYLGFLRPRLEQSFRLLTRNGSFFLHIDPRESHYVKVELDRIFGRECFMNEIVWAYDFGGRSRKKWSAKHDCILWYTRNPDDYTFRYQDIDRIPYLAPGLVGPKKAERGKTPTDVWWQTIVSPNGKEKTGYPTQKPIVILNRIIAVHSNPKDLVLDFFAGSGTTGEAAVRAGRNVVLIDEQPDAIAVMTERLKFVKPTVWESPTLDQLSDLIQHRGSAATVSDRTVVGT